MRSLTELDGVLLVDAEAERVVAVELGSPGDEGSRGSVHWLAVFASGVAVGALLGWIARL